MGAEAPQNSADLAPFVTASHILVEGRLYGKDDCLNEDSLTTIETFLAAHFASVKFRQALSESGGGMSESFQNGGLQRASFASTSYGQTAMTLDCSGILSQIAGDIEKGRGKRRIGIYGGSDAGPEDPNLNNPGFYSV